jgi:hypothetical protein
VAGRRRNRCDKARPTHERPAEAAEGGASRNHLSGRQGGSVSLSDIGRAARRPGGAGPGPPQRPPAKTAKRSAAGQGTRGRARHNGLSDGGEARRPRPDRALDRSNPTILTGLRTQPHPSTDIWPMWKRRFNMVLRLNGEELEHTYYFDMRVELPAPPQVPPAQMLRCVNGDHLRHMVEPTFVRYSKDRRD